MDTVRYNAELAVLGARLPETAFRFLGIGTDKPYLRIGARTNSGNVYTLHVDLSAFPESVPKVFVTRMLKDINGDDMSGVSAAMHTLQGENGWTRICHYGYSSWTPGVSIYKIYVKCRLWLEMYEAHLRSGHPIDYYLNHQA